MSKISEDAAWNDADAALNKAIDYDAQRTSYLQADDFTAAGHAERLREDYFNRAVELTNA